MLLKFLSLIFKFKIKLVFFPPPKKKYLLYHKASFFVSEYLQQNSYNVLHTKLDEFNIFVFFKSLFTFKEAKKLTTRYVLTYIDLVKPKFIISSIDNQISLYNLKKYFDETIVIAIQNGVRNYTPAGFEYDIEQKRDYLKKLNLSCDFFFIMSKKDKLVYSEFIKCKFIESGSIKSNMCPIEKTTTNEVVYISQYAHDKMNNEGINYRAMDEILIKNTLYFCDRENIKCSILLRTNLDAEKQFYNLILKDKIKNVIFVKINENKEKFKFLDRFSLILTVDSTLGYEMISRNKKTIIASARDQFLEKENNLRKVSFGFKYNEHYQDQGPFWINRFKKEEEILKKIEEVYFSSNEKILSEYKKYKDALFYVDQNNTKLKEILNETK